MTIKPPWLYWGPKGGHIDQNQQQEALGPAADAISTEIAGLLGLELPDVVAITGGLIDSRCNVPRLDGNIVINRLEVLT